MLFGFIHLLYFVSVFTKVNHSKLVRTELRSVFQLTILSSWVLFHSHCTSKRPHLKGCGGFQRHRSEDHCPHRKSKWGTERAVKTPRRVQAHTTRARPRKSRQKPRVEDGVKRGGIHNVDAQGGESDRKGRWGFIGKMILNRNETMLNNHPTQNVARQTHSTSKETEVQKVHRADVRGSQNWRTDLIKLDRPHSEVWEP